MKRFNLFILLGMMIMPAVAAPPSAPVHPVTDDYFGTQVVDNYRWMETPDNPELAAWMKAQADYTRRVLASIPGRDALLKRITALDDARVHVSNVIQRGERLFYEKVGRGEQLPKLYYQDGLQGAEHLLFDPAKLGTATLHYALDYYAPSWDGRYVAYGVSAGGSEQSTVHVLDTTGRTTFAEAIDRTTDNRINWRADNRGFFYLRFSKLAPGAPLSEQQYNARAYLHSLGAHPDGEGDPVVFGRGVSASVDVPEGQGTYVVVSADSSYAVAVANRNMDNNPMTLFAVPMDKIKGADTPWKKLADVEDGVTAFCAHGDSLYFLSQKGASHFRLLRTSLANPDVAHADVVVPEGRAVITDFGFAKDGLYVRARDGAVSTLRKMTADGKQAIDVPTPFAGTVSDLVAGPETAGILFNMTGWVQAERWYRYDPSTNVTRDTGLLPASDVDTAQFEAREAFATSYDGTRIPLSIVSKKGIALDSSHPALLVGYGSYGISQEAFFTPVFLAWTERGGILAFSHIRGGGEYGEDWHTAGQKLTKINTILDFIACGQFLVDQHYTSPRYLAGLGGSAGGITVGGALTWRPDLFGTIIDEVGLSDALRMETTPNGPPNVAEFGSVKTEQGFHGLYAMSAYAHVRDGTAYPAVLFTTGANDPRVAPWIVAKMAARTQAATSSGKPVLLRVDYDAGHGIGSERSQFREELADVMAFILWQAGDPAFQPH